MSGQDQAAVLVLGAQHPTGLMTARALRGLGVRIIALAYSDSPCLRSSVWSSLLMIEKTPETVMRAVLATAAEQRGRLLLLPADDDSVKILSDQRHALPPSCFLLMPEAEKVDLLLDKSQFYPWAVTHGFSVPKTIEIANFEELDRAILEIGYPLLLKPMYRTGLWDEEIPGDKVFILETLEQYVSVPRHLFAVAPVMLAQQWIPGSDADIYFCLVSYDQKGKLLDYFCGRKLMQWPPLGGSTAVAVSDEQEESRELTLALFDAVGFQGLGSVEYKKDPRTGKLYIMEPTVGRNDFQSYLAVSGNVNLTASACQDALGALKKPVGHHHPSAWICEPSFYYGLKYCLRHRDGSFLRYIRFLFRKIGFAYLDFRDMAPFFAFLKSRLK